MTLLLVDAKGNFSSISFDATQATPGVPEASTWAMMILGFAGIGALLIVGAGMALRQPEQFWKSGNAKTAYGRSLDVCQNKMRADGAFLVTAASMAVMKHIIRFR